MAQINTITNNNKKVPPLFPTLINYQNQNMAGITPRVIQQKPNQVILQDDKTQIILTYSQSNQIKKDISQQKSPEKTTISSKFEHKNEKMSVIYSPRYHSSKISPRYRSLDKGYLRTEISETNRTGLKKQAEHNSKSQLAYEISEIQIINFKQPKKIISPRNRKKPVNQEIPNQDKQDKIVVDDYPSDVNKGSKQDLPPTEDVQTHASEARLKEIIESYMTCSKLPETSGKKQTVIQQGLVNGKPIFEEYEIIHLEKISQNQSGSIITNLIAHAGNVNSPFHIQKQFANIIEYECEKQIYENLSNNFYWDINRFAILMEGYRDDIQEIYFNSGKCTLLELATKYKQSNQLLPNLLIVLTFKVIASLIFRFFEKGFYYTNIKPENIIIESVEPCGSLTVLKQQYTLKFVDFGSLSNQIQISSGYSPEYYTSRLMLQRKAGEIIKFESREERLYNEFYTLLRTLQKIMVDSNLEFMFMEFEDIRTNAENNFRINQFINEVYKSQIEYDKVYGKTVLKIFSFMNNYVAANQDFEIIKEILGEIKIPTLEEDSANNYIQQISSYKIQNKANEINPLEKILSLNYLMELFSSKYGNEDTNKKLEDVAMEYLLNNSKNIFLLLGKSGSGKSFFLRRFYAKLNRTLEFEKVLANQNTSIQRQIEAKYKINYSYQCKYIKLNQFSGKERKEDFKEEIQKTIGRLKSSEKLILLLDGFDEFGEKKDIILNLIGFKSNNSPSFLLLLQSRLKIIVTCRSTEITEEQQKNIFNAQGKDSTTEVGYICAVKKEQMHNYIRQFVQIVSMYKDSKLFGKFNAFKTYEEYKDMLDSSTALQDMATEPFTIRLLVGIMPLIKDKCINQSKNIVITLYEVLQIFVDKWIENEVCRLSQEEKYILAENIVDIDSEKLLDNMELVLTQINNVTLKIIEYLWINNLISNNNFNEKDLEQISSHYLIDSRNLKVLIKCLPIAITTSGNNIQQYGFFHKSIIDYFLAHFWINDFINLKAEQDSLKSLSTFNITKQFINKSEFPSLIMLSNYVTESANRQGSSSLLYRQLVDICLQILELSKNDNFKELQGSSNAITILNSLKFSFSGLNLSHIKIKNAYLDEGIFDGTNLSFAEIENTVISRTNLDRCNLENAKVKDIDLGIPRPDLLGHKCEVRSIAISQDGQLIVSGSMDETVKVWSFETGSQITTLIGHNDIVSSVAISSDSRYIISGSWDNTVRIWEWKTGKEIRSLNGHNGSVTTVAISPDGRLIISGSGDKSIKIWSWENGTLIRTINCHSSVISSIAISSNGKYLVSGSWDMTIKVQCLEVNSQVLTLVGHLSRISSVTLSSDCKLIISGSWDNTIKIWNFETGLEIATLSSHSDPVTSVVLSPDDKYIVSSSEDRSIKIWNLETASLITTLSGHSKEVSQVVISSDGQYIVSGSYEGIIRIWNLEKNLQATNRTGHSKEISQVTLCSNGRILLSGSFDRSVKIWNIETCQQIATRSDHNQAVYSVAISSNGKYIVTGSSDNTVSIWNYETGLIRSQKCHSGSVNSIAITNDCKYIITGSRDSSIKVWDFESFAIVNEFKDHCKSVNAIVLSKDEKYLVSCSQDKTIKLWGFKSESLITTLYGHSESVTSVAISFDSRYIVTGSNDRTIKTWNVEYGTQIRSFVGHNKEVISVALNSDGNYVISGSRDCLIKIWLFATGSELFTITGHNSSITSLFISPDDKLIISGSFDNSIKIWNFQIDGETTTQNLNQEYYSTVVEIAPDKKYHVSIHKDNKVQIEKVKLLNDSEQDLESLKDNKQIKASSHNQENLVFYQKPSILMQKIIQRNQTHKLINSIQKLVPNFSCKEINLQNCNGLTKTQLRIFAQRSGQNFDDLIEQAYN